MEASRARDLFIALSMTMTMVILLNTVHSGASGPILLRGDGNATLSGCYGSEEECLIAHTDTDLEFQMPSEISRRVLATAPKIAPGRLDQNNIGLCQTRNTDSCVGKQRNKKYIAPNCGNNYERSCQK